MTQLASTPDQALLFFTFSFFAAFGGATGSGGATTFFGFFAVRASSSELSSSLDSSSSSSDVSSSEVDDTMGWATAALGSATACCSYISTENCISSTQRRTYNVRGGSNITTVIAGVIALVYELLSYVFFFSSFLGHIRTPTLQWTY